MPVPLSPAETADRRPTAPGHSGRATWLMSVAFILWAVWAVGILATPMHSGRVADVARALERHDDVHWLVVQRPTDDGPAGHFAPGLADPLTQEWEDSALTTPHENGGDGAGTLSSTHEQQVAWSDSSGLHVTTDFSITGWRIGKDGWPDPASSPSASLYRTLATQAASTRVTTVRALTPLGTITYGGGSGTVETYGAVMLVSCLAALGSLLARPPRFRTRWSWFWIFGCPMGVGLVWYLTREGWFGRAPAPAPDRRQSGLTGFAAFIGISWVLGSLVHAWLFR